MKVIFLAKEKITNPYLELLSSSLKKEIGQNLKIEYYSPKILRDIEEETILHIHWPEIVLTKNNYKNNVLRKINSLFRLINFLKTILVNKAKGNFKIIWTVHNYRSHDNIFPMLEDFLNWNLFRLVDNFIVHTEAGRKFLMHAGVQDKKIKVVPHGSFRNYYPNGPNKPTARRRMGLSEKTRIFLNLGLKRQYKRLDFLINEFAKLSSDNDVKLLIMGNGSKKTTEYLGQFGTDKIIIEGENIKDSLISTYLAAADFFVITNENFLSSGAAVLALSYGLPVIAPNEGDMPYIIRNNENGFLYERRGKNDLINTINKAVDLTNEELERMSRNCASNMDEPSWDLVATETSKIYSRT